jgi:penicillin-binding protein 2
VQVVEGERFSTLADSNRISARLIAPPRGRLLDRHGVVIAGNRLNWRALLVAEQSGDLATTLDNFNRVVPLADHERLRIERELRRRRRFIPVTIREFLTWEDMARIEVNAPDLPGILVDVGTTREYPFGPGLAHIVGYVAPPAERDVGNDPLLELPGVRVGRSGVERQHDLLMRGRAGAVQLEVNAVGRVIREVERREGVAGQEVQLTIDTELQRAIRGKIEEGTSAVVMDCRNGEVLAMASQPSFDPNLFNSGVSTEQWRDWTRNRSTPLINKCTNGLYAPGSTFKMMVALAALEARLVTPGERITCPGYMDLGESRFHCWSKYGHGGVDLRAGLKHSCDVYFYELAKRLGIDRIAAMSNKFGLGVEPEIDLPGARKGLVPTRAWRQAQGKGWSLGDTIIHGIGQGYYQLTPLQLATMTARLATGRAEKPHLTRAIGGVVARGDRPEHWPVIGVSERNLRLVREAMNAVVNEQGGTAYASRLPDRQLMAGKTGTTQVRRITMADRARGIVSNANRPWEHRDHALFVAYAPYEAPAYAIAVIIEHGGGGSAAAAPVARDIRAETLARDPARRAPPAPAAPPTRTAETRQDRG